jgi:hypothetical protein
MGIDSRSGGLFDRHLGRLRAEWVAAFGAWTRVADGKAPTSSGLSDEQRAAVRRNRAAETAYFTYLRVRTDRLPDE